MASGLVEVTNRDDAFAGVTYVIADERDDVSSLRTRLGTVSGWRVALILPRRSRALESPNAMRVIARAAVEEGVNLAIVSARARTRWLAEREGLPAYPSVRAIPARIRAALPERESPLAEPAAAIGRGLRAGFSWLFALGLVFAIVVFAIFTIPREVVTVRPYTERLDGAVQLKATTDAATPDPKQGVVPGRQLYFAIGANGSVPVGVNRPLDGYAIGNVTFTNRTNQRLTVPAGTDVQTYEGNHFVTIQPVGLPGHQGATAVARVKATAPGPSGNVRGGSILQVNGPLHWDLLVVNGDDMAGGGAPGQKVVTPWEKTALIQQVTAKAEAEAKTELTAQTAPGEAAVPETVQVTPIAETFDHAIGQPADQLTLQSQFRVSAMLVDPNEIKQLSTQMWNPRIPSDFAVRPGSVVVDPATVAKVDASSVTFNVPMHAVIFKTIDPSQIAREVRFRDEKTARQNLGRLFDLAAPPQVQITPDWTGRAYRVQVIVDTSAPPAPPTEPSQTTAVTPSAPAPAASGQSIGGSGNGAR